MPRRRRESPAPNPPALAEPPPLPTGKRAKPSPAGKDEVEEEVDARIEGLILSLAQGRAAGARVGGGGGGGVGGTICPSEVARAISSSESVWRPLMPRIREVAARLIQRGREQQQQQEASSSSSSSSPQPHAAAGAGRSGERGTGMGTGRLIATQRGVEVTANIAGQGETSVVRGPIRLKWEEKTSSGSSRGGGGGAE